MRRTIPLLAFFLITGFFGQATAQNVESSQSIPATSVPETAKAIAADCRMEADMQTKFLDPIPADLEARYKEALLMDPALTGLDYPPKKDWLGAQNATQARAIYEELAAKGHHRAAVRLASVLASGKGGPRDLGRTMDIYITLAKSGTRSEGDGLIGLADFFFWGVDGISPPNPEKGLNCLQRAAEKGFTTAQLDLGAMLLHQYRTLYLLSSPTPHDPPNIPLKPVDGEYWMLKAAEQGRLEAYHVLSNYFYYNDLSGKRKPDLKKSEHYARLGAKKGSKACLFQLSTGYKPETGEYGQSAELYQCYRKLYSTGKEGEPLDLDKLCPRPQKAP